MVMYKYMMKRYTVSQARTRIAEVLDSAERGETVAIERRGVQFRIVATKARRRRKRAPMIEILDPAVERGQWTWTEGPQGWDFTPRRPR
jgi:antitoxin (DNA-binding transcriptional repressor) of toxin-antitoxin stability system